MSATHPAQAGGRRAGSGSGTNKLPRHNPLSVDTNNHPMTKVLKAKDNKATLGIHAATPRCPKVKDKLVNAAKGKDTPQNPM